MPENTKKPAYTQDEIDWLTGKPGIAMVTPNRVIYDLQFKTEVYDEWAVDQHLATVRRAFVARGWSWDDLDDRLIKQLAHQFSSQGRPQKQALIGRVTDGDGKSHKTEEELLNEGVLTRTNNMVRLSEGFKEMLKKSFLAAKGERSIEDIVRDCGYDPVDLGLTRLKYIRKTLKIENEKQRDLGSQKGIPPVFWAQKTIEETPFIRNGEPGCIEFTEVFCHDAAQFRDLDVQEILSIYCIPPEVVPDAMYDVVKKALYEGESTPVVVAFDLQVAINRYVMMHRLVEEALEDVKERFQQMTPPEKKRVCEIIDQLPRDTEYTNKFIRDRLGISQTAYYKYLRRERYGMEKTEKALSDIEAVRKVYEYKGFKKGSRQIYMLMPKIVGRKIGLKKIRRIMRENGMESEIRTPNMQKRAIEKYLKENRKPNLLDRRFRLYRPNQVRLTDVTCIDYGKNKQRAYGSASIDPVTGKLVAFVVMETNDQKLADATLREMDNFPCEFGGKFHSDQGTLYLMPEFQAKVAERGLDQSMSRRANCWDNAPQESFFGHFKDECDYASCETLDELHDLIEGYKYYFNYERGMWDRQKMTPVDYESYLSSLSEDEFQKYLDDEEIRYREMKAHSIELAKKRAKDLGAEEDDEAEEEAEAKEEADEGGGDDE